MRRAERKQSSPCFRQLPNYQQSAANLVQRILARCFRSRNKCRLLGNAPHDLSVCFVPAPALGGQAKSTRAIEGSQITSAMLLPADKASCARSGEGTVVEVNTNRRRVRLLIKAPSRNSAQVYFKRGSWVEMHLAARIAESASALLPSIAGRPPGGFCR